MMYPNFNKEEHFKRMQKQVPALLKELTKIDITQLPDSGDNVVFTNGTKEMRIANHLFYRVSGLCTITKDVGKSEIEWVTVTDEMYIVTFMGNVIKTYLS